MKILALLKMTSLSRQLKKLAAPQTSLLKLDKKKPSLLFDPLEAANLDRDAVFEIGRFSCLVGFEAVTKILFCRLVGS